MVLSLEIAELIDPVSLGYVIFERIDREDAELVYLELKLENPISRKFPAEDEPRPDKVQADAELAFFRVVGGPGDGGVLIVWVW